MILQLVSIMDSSMVSVVQDTLNAANNCLSTPDTNVPVPALDIFYKVSMVVIALFNIAYAIWLYRQNKKSSREKNLFESRRAMLSLLILNHKMTDFYKYMSEIHDSTYRFVKEKKSNSEIKKEIEDSVLESFINLRLHFIDVFEAVDKPLAEKLLQEADNLQSVISTAIWDSGINLNVEEKYNEQIMNPISNAQTRMLKLLFNFK